MKILSIYLLLACLALLLLVGVDLLSGMSLDMSVHSLYSVFATTSLQEAVCMFIFVALPFMETAASALKRNKPSQR